MTQFCAIKILKTTRQHLKDIQFDYETYDDVILELMRFKPRVSHKRKSHKRKMPYIDFIDEMIKENKK